VGERLDGAGRNGRRDPGPDGRVDARGEERREEAGDGDEGGEDEDRPAHRRSGLVRVRGRVRAGAPEEDDAEELRERPERDGPRDRERGRRERGEERGVGPRERAEEADVDDELREEAGERREGERRRAADGERGAGPRHPPEEPSEPVHLARPRPVDHRPRAEEEERLEEEW
jgi:hypothetical protein